MPCTTHSTYPDKANYVWDPATGETREGEAGQGPVIMAVDNLPCEFPIAASIDFGDAFLPFVRAIAEADFSAGFEAARSSLPVEIAPAVIVASGGLTPDYSYLADAVSAAAPFGE